MSIRLRLVLSYTAMIFVPVLLFIVSALLIALIFLGDIRNLAEYYDVKFQEGSIQNYFDQSSLAEAELKHTTMFDPDRLLESSYLDSFEERLAALKMSLIVRKNESILYTTPRLAGKVKSEELPGFQIETGRGPHDDMDSIHLVIEGKTYSFSTYDFYFSDKTQGSLFILSDITPLKQLGQKFNPALLVAFLLALILTNGMLTYFVSRSILKPLRELRQAADHIKAGNLDFSLKTRRNDELGQLSRAFEEMRVKLKESIEIRLQYEENRKELISNISHDLKTPITGIIGYVEGIRDGVANDLEKQAKYMDTIYTKAKNLDRLIDELFLYSKLDLNSMPFEFQQVSLVSFIHDCIDELKLDLEKKYIHLEWVNPNIAEFLQVRMDGEKLKRVMINIIENSCNFMDKKPAMIHIRTKQGTKAVTIEIEDNGAGISQADLPYIFDRFYRADKSRNLNGNGSGLGLAIAKQIVEAHEGTITADSEIGKGTKMTITLPVYSNGGAHQ